MDVESYLIGSSQLTSVFDCADSFIQQKKREDLNNSREDLFLVVKCKNAGNYYAFGDLIFHVKGMNLPIPVLCSGLHGNMQTFSDIAVIYIGSLYITGDDEFPKVTYHWKTLYTL